MAIIVGVIIAALYWFFGTELGCAIRATGNNRKMARAQGISTRFMTIVALMLSNGLVGLAGALIAQNQSFADMSMGIGSIVIALASLIIGEVLFGKRNFFLRLLSWYLARLFTASSSRLCCGWACRATTCGCSRRSPWRRRWRCQSSRDILRRLKIPFGRRFRPC